MAKAPVVLIIRDGWGVNPGGQETAEKDGNASLLAKTPFHDVMLEKYPKGFVSASGLDVGLPDGQMGNSEVGHLNLGAGRIVYQDLTRINKTIADGALGDNEILKAAFAKARRKRLHLIGLLSDGGVHSHQDHLVALAGAAREAGVDDIMVHAITDGRDTSPTGGKDYLGEVEDKLAAHGARIATVVGRYYAMDRDKRWERTKLAWDAIVLGRGEKREVLASEAVAEHYAHDKTDEFMPAMVFDEADTQRINDGDVVLFFNFRADRARQLSVAFLQKDFDGFDTEVKPDIEYVTLTEYDETYGVPVVFAPETLEKVLGEVVSAAGRKQLRIAETEKYPHVTYFFNGGVEQQFDGEDRKIIPSPKDVATYDLKPQMSAEEVTATVVANLRNYDLVILNFANPDMVGHTGVVNAAVKACEVIDAGVKAVVEETLRLGGKLLITADHGNCEFMINEDGSPHTAHTTNLVHAVYVADDADTRIVNDGILADVAPTLLAMLGLDQPAEMTGKSLVVDKMKNLIAGIRDYWRAQRLLFRKGLWTAFLVPGILSVLYFPVSIVIAVTVMTGAAEYVHDHWIPAFLQGPVTMWMLAVFMWFAAIYVGFLMFRNVIMILYSPVLAHLSETAEDRELGRDQQGFDWREVLHSAGRGTGMSLLSLVLAVVALVLGWGLALVPVVGGLVAIVWMAVTQFYLAGVGFCDPPMERRRKGVGETFSHAWRHRGRTLGHGIGFSLLLLVPVVGWFLAPSYGIVAGTLGVIDTEGAQENFRN